MKIRPLNLAMVAAAVAALLLACDSPLPTGVGEDVLNASRVQRSGTPQAVPLKGSTKGMVIGVHPYGSPDWAAQGCPSEAYAVVYEYLGYGQATHLGRFSIHGSECLNGETLQTAKAEYTLTAANGDEIEFGYISGFAIPQPPFPPTVFHWTAQGLWCDGGTGRFASATCEGAWSGGFNMATGETWSTIDATITYDASDRRN
jgi:hypothetical protein